MKFLSNFSLRKLLYNKQFTVPFSILLAFTLWLVIVVKEKPIIELTFSDVPVNINLENTFVAENDMKIIGDISKQRFTVTVRGPSATVSKLTSSDLSLYASAGEVDAPGDYNLKVAATSVVNSAEYDITSISPPTIKINFDYVETKDFTLVANAEGAVAASGLIAENGVVSGAESGSVTVTGPRTVVNKIETAKANTVVNKTLNASETFEADIVLYDSENNVINPENLTLSITKVKVTVPISKKKSVPVKVDFSNTPAGFNSKAISTTIDNNKVTVIGTPETVDKTNEIVLSPIDITTVTATSNKFQLAPKLPEGVRILESIDVFNVTVNTNGYILRTFTVSDIRYKGVPSGLKASGPKTIANVKVFGPRSVINSLRASDIYAEINLTDKSAGVYTVDALISFKTKKNIWAQGVYTTTVTLK